MDIRDYEYIVAIAEQGGITRAAEQLFITQSALTRFLQRTEQRLGVELFLRRGKQFLLTEAGHTYVEPERKPSITRESFRHRCRMGNRPDFSIKKATGL